IPVKVGVRAGGGYCLPMVQIRQGQRIDLPVIILVPTTRADILNYRHYRTGHLSLNAETPIPRTRRGVVVLERRHVGGEMLLRGRTTLDAGVGVGEVNVIGGRLIGKGWVQGGVVHVVALDALKEHTKSSPQYRLAIST